MYSRNRLDIGWMDLMMGVGFGLFSHKADQHQQDLDGLWHSDGLSFSTVRTAWDALLQELNLPEGSEVLCSAVNIPDIFEILSFHGLVPVPVDLNLRTMAVEDCDWSASINDRTRLVLVAHLLGTRSDLDRLFSLCASRSIAVVEDCAQAFDGLNYTGDSRALASLFSFGPIKTRSSLGGGIGIIRDPHLRDRIWKRCADYPRQSRWDYLSRVLKYGGMKMLTHPLLYRLFVQGCRGFGRSHDQVINGAVLGLKGEDYLKVLRTRPSAPLIDMLRRRLRPSNECVLESRTASGNGLLDDLSQNVFVLGSEAEQRSWWQFCVLSPDPKSLITHLRKRGFDATDGSSRLAPVTAPQGYLEPERTRVAMKHVVYVPAYSQLGAQSRRRLVSAFQDRPDLVVWDEAR